MKTVFSNNELVHIWANQKQESGKGSNMFFNGPKIYSYGYHFCIANIFKGVVLFTTHGYSKTTDKHKSLVSRAINQKYFNVPYVELDSSYKEDLKKYHAGNIQYYKNQINDCLNKAETSNKNSDWLISQAKYYQTCGLDYCETFKQSKKQIKFFTTPIELTEQVKKRVERQIEKVRIQKEESERIEKQNRDLILQYCLPYWIKGMEVSAQPLAGKVFKSSHVSELKESYLRLTNDSIETSHGARVSLQAAKILFEMIKQGKDIKGHEIDGYTVISLNGVLTIGCHKIERTEINRFASLMNWGKIDLH